jgi:hypothetical protein
MYSDEDYDGGSSINSEGVDQYCASCDIIQEYYDACVEEDNEEDDWPILI